MQDVCLELEGSSLGSDAQDLDLIVLTSKVVFTSVVCLTSWVIPDTSSFINTNAN